MLKIGDKAPEFCLKNQDDIEISLRDLGGKIVVLYFYPKDNTPGCTLEGQEFSALLPEFESKNALVIGISPDSTKTHKNFITKQQFGHMLLSDGDKSVATRYGAYGKKMMYGKEVMGIIRSTFIIKDEIIQEAFYNIRAKGHAKAVLERIQ
ncbi:peroxiredoxin [Helicobacter mustelae]|uniref:Putative peroxiredoxin bcp n=1 Tax=Helicobacter mustelae (strain ATCC 43772 / CCUG 25715 / CIP 103759 / LMG 18044 / NCTC 12198 / R85-136P) TaxID=679897 RepID=D3UHT5_HELM1|nr:peroxiredoxin [Helicobacter mustelae]CBG40058.1 bacterioferritin comigratory protein homolog, Bcp [Helicobacter mustelae 12198]SQH71572.1 bacterioferritin comigratory protein [Helicobacter mustelae]